MSNNPCGLKGIEFVEYASPDNQMLHNIFTNFGFSKLMASTSNDLTYYKQNDIHFIINNRIGGHADGFKKIHGPSICGMGLRVENAVEAFDTAVKNGAKKADGEYSINGKKVPTIFGIGDSLIYFVDNYRDENFYEQLGFQKTSNPEILADKGFMAIDHLTNNVTSLRY